MFKILDGRKEFYQWDLDRKLIVSDPTITEVHFCNQTDSCSLVCEVYEKDNLHLVNVPNILLQNDLTIRVYGYCGECYTKQSAYFKVMARTKPADYIYTETEVKSWEALEKKCNEAIDGKLDKATTVSGGFNLYGTKYNDATTQMFRIDNGTASLNGIPMYYSSDNEYVNAQTGCVLATGTPKRDAHAANKKYVDDGLSGKLDKLSNLSYAQIVVCNVDGTTSGIYWTAEDQVHKLMYRDGTGNTKVKAPTKDLHCANKQYVDDLFGSVDSALDRIIAIQNSLLGGNA